MQLMPIDNVSTIFTGNYAKESFRINKMWEEHPVGAIIRAILDVSPSTYESLNNIAARLGQIHSTAKKMSYDFKDSINYLVRDYISAVHSINCLDIPDYLKSLFKLLPVQFNYVCSNHIRQYSEYYSHNKNAYLTRLLPFHTDITMLDIYQISHEFSLPFNTSNLTHKEWYAMLCCLTDRPTVIVPLIQNIDTISLLHLLDVYSKSFCILITEAFELKTLLETALSNKNRDHIDTKALISKLPNLEYSLPSHITEYDWGIVQKTYLHKKKRSSFYTATSLSALVYLELLLMEENDLFMKTCSCCQNPFITSFIRAKYCHFPNADLDGKTCQDVASRLKHLANKPLSVQRNKNRDRYKKWAEPIVTESRDYIKELKRSILTSAVYATSVKERKAYFRSIIQEVATLFEKWDADSQAAIREFYNEKITRDECEARIAYPPERDRGPMLYDILDRKQDAP